MAISIVSGVLLARFRTPSQASLELDRKLAQLRKDGVPLTGPDLAKLLPDPAPAQDARLILQPAFDWKPGPANPKILPLISTNELPRRTDRISAVTMKELPIYLTNSDALISTFPKDSAGIRFSMKWTNGIEMSERMPTPELRQLTMRLALISVYEAELQNSGRAANSLCAGFTLARIVNDDDLVSTMIRVAVEGVMCRATEQVLSRCPLSNPELYGIHQRIDPAFTGNFTNAFMTERVVAVEHFDKYRSGKAGKRNRLHLRMSASEWLDWFRGERKPLYRDEDYLFYLSHLEDRQRMIKLPPLEILRWTDRLTEQYRTMTFSEAADGAYITMQKVFRMAIEGRARMECTRTALAIERYRLAHQGNLPESLKQMVPDYLAEAPLDPMDNQPLRFKRLERGYVVYSIGADGVDDGGKERLDGNATNQYDVTFTVER
ncbi:MAG TPA: hypothetical protein VK968_20695 [Roseimicrobium sp.]|nr:hypothetical protein [Roseimicrobium sp.]